MIDYQSLIMQNRLGSATELNERRKSVKKSHAFLAAADKTVFIGKDSRGNDLPVLKTIAELRSNMMPGDMPEVGVQCNEVWALPDDIQRCLESFTYATVVRWTNRNGMERTLDNIIVNSAGGELEARIRKYLAVMNVLSDSLKCDIYLVWWTGPCVSE